MTTATLDRPAPTVVALHSPAIISRKIAVLARLVATLPSLDGTQQSRLVELFTALLAAGVDVDALGCALEDAAQEVEG